MKKIDFRKSGILLKETIIDKVIAQERIDLRNGDVFMEKAYLLASGEIKRKIIRLIT